MQIKNKNGNTYTVIATQNSKTLLKDNYGNYLVAIDMAQNEQGECFWGQGKYFLSDLSASKAFLKSK